MEEEEGEGAGEIECGERAEAKANGTEEMSEREARNEGGEWRERREREKRRKRNKQGKRYTTRHDQVELTRTDWDND